MTQLLETALQQVAQLPDDEQDAIAALIVEEIRSEHRWRAAFDRSQDQLATLAREALVEYRAGKTRPLEPDAL